jgi:uncharacterized protein
MNCPNCQVKMKDTQKQGVKLEYCPRCRGIWLQRGDLDNIIQRTMSLAMPFPGQLEAGEATGEFALSGRKQPKKSLAESEPTKFHLSELFEVE